MSDPIAQVIDRILQNGRRPHPQGVVTVTELETELQVQYYHSLRKHEVPGFCREGLFSNHHCGHFLQALYKACFEDKNPWCLDRPFKHARQQAERMSPNQLKIFTNRWFRDICVFSLVMPFSCTENDPPERALNIVRRCVDALLHEGAIHAEHLEFGPAYLLCTLIGAQKYTQTWTRFVRAFKNEAVSGQPGPYEQVFARMFDLWLGRTKPPIFTPASQLPAIPTREELASIVDRMERMIGDKRVAEIPVPDECVKFCNDWLGAKLNDLAAMTPAWERCLLQFSELEEQYAAHAEQMWREIQTHPSRYVVWPTGHDVVAIGVKELRDRGFRCIQLFGGDFPNFKGRVWTELPLSGTMVYLDFDIDRPRLRYAADPEDLSELPGKRLLRYLCILAYWSIVTGQYAAKAHHHQMKTAEGTGMVALKRKPVRPHTPRLPKGKEPTEYALARCRKILKDEPDPGRTFAMARDQEAAVQALLASKPNLNMPLFSITTAKLRSQA